MMSVVNCQTLSVQINITTYLRIVYTKNKLFYIYLCKIQQLTRYISGHNASQFSYISLDKHSKVREIRCHSKIESVAAYVFVDSQTVLIYT